MLDNDEKRIIRIKDLESNCIEELLIILKNTTKKIDKEDLKYIVINDDNNFIIREAEMIIDDYINNKNEVFSSYAPRKAKIFKIDLNWFLNFLLITSIIGGVTYFFVK